MNETKQTGAAKTARIPIKVVPAAEPLKKPSWIRVRLGSDATRFAEVKHILRDHQLHTVCEEATCPNFGECFAAVREHSPGMRIEVLVPDFRGRLDIALDILAATPPDVMNHNLETVPRLYRQARPGAEYAHSLQLLKAFKARRPEVATKSGLMVGLGEDDEEILAVLRDLRAHDVEMLTIGQYLAPSAHHLPVLRYVPPETFVRFEREAAALGFAHAACAPLVRSSYHADRQAHAAGI